MDEDPILEDAPAPVTDTPIDSDAQVKTALDTAAVDFDQELRNLFSDKDYKTLRTIGVFLVRGITLEEACVLSRLSYDKFELIMHDHPAVRDFITFKKASYKAGLMTTMAASGITGRQTKTAGYLLENQYRDEFGKKNKDETVRPKDALEHALEAVRENGDSTPLIKRLPLPKFAGSGTSTPT